MEDKDLYISKIETSQMNYTNNLHRLSKEDFLKLCSDFYDGNIEAEYKGNIAYRLSNITECILKDFNDGKIVVSRKEIIAIANIVWDYFMRTLNLIKENIDTQEDNKNV